MKTKPIRIRLHDSDLEAIKKRGVAGGKNISETIRDLIHSGLENRSESHHVSGQGIDPETVRKEVDSAISFWLEPAMKTLNLLRAEISGLSKSRVPDPVGNGSGSAPEISPEVIRFLAGKVARIDALLEVVAAKTFGKSVEVVREGISVDLSRRPAAEQGGNGPEMIRFVAEKAARIDALLVGVSSKISGSNVGDHGDRMKQANVMAQTEIKKLFGGVNGMV